MKIKTIVISGDNKFGSLSLSLQKAFESNNIIAETFNDTISIVSKRIITRIFIRILIFLHKLKIQDRFYQYIEKKQPDAILILKGFFFSEKLIKKIRYKFPDILLIYFNPDNIFNNWHFGNSNSSIINSIKFYDINLIWTNSHREKMISHGAKSVFLFPFAADPFLYKVELQNIKNDYKYDISFIGSWDDERERILNELLNFDLNIWGNDWYKANPKLRKKWKGVEVVGDNLLKICLQSKINLNLIRKQNIPGLNMRTFEIPYCGGFFISTRTKDATNIFQEDLSGGYFTSTEELKTKINYFLKNKELRTKNIFFAKEISKNHTYEIRVRDLLKYINNINYPND